MYFPNMYFPFILENCVPSKTLWKAFCEDLSITLEDLDVHLCFSVLAAGVNPLQLQNFATLAAAAAAAQSSGSPNSSNAMSANSAALGALASPGN